MKCPYDAHNLHCGHPMCIERDPRCYAAHLTDLKNPIEVCLGCGKPTADRDCGCPAGTGLRQRPGDQPLPTKNNQVYCADRLVAKIEQRYATEASRLLIADIKKRKEVGITRYGTALQPFNGRDFMRDLLEEICDALSYGEGLLEETRNSETERYHDQLIQYAVYLRGIMKGRESRD